METLFKIMYFIEKVSQKIEEYCFFLAIAPMVIVMYIYIHYQQFKKEKEASHD